MALALVAIMQDRKLYFCMKTLSTKDNTKLGPSLFNLFEGLKFITFYHAMFIKPFVDLRLKYYTLSFLNTQSFLILYFYGAVLHNLVPVHDKALQFLKY